MSMIIDSSRSQDLEKGLDNLESKLKVLSNILDGQEKEMFNRIISVAVKQNIATEANNEGANHLSRYLKNQILIIQKIL